MKGTRNRLNRIHVSSVFNFLPWTASTTRPTSQPVKYNNNNNKKTEIETLTSVIRHFPFRNWKINGLKANAQMSSMWKIAFEQSMSIWIELKMPECLVQNSMKTIFIFFLSLFFIQYMYQPAVVTYCVCIIYSMIGPTLTYLTKRIVLLLPSFFFLFLVLASKTTSPMYTSVDAKHMKEEKIVHNTNC